MQQHEVSDKASAEAATARIKREVMAGMLETLIGLAMKKTVDGKNAARSWTDLSGLMPELIRRD